MPAILISILASVLGGSSIGAVLGALSIDSWLTLAVGIISLEPDIASLFGLQHPALGTLVKEIGAGVAPVIASQTAKDWFSANADKAIELQPGIGNQ